MSAVTFFDWLVHTDAGLLARVATGVAVFGVLALVDLRRRGRHATRWREYGVLLACTLAAMAYGAANDAVTSSISWEYYFYGKDVAAEIGSGTPPDPWRLKRAAMVIGVKATWSAGLIVGVALLLANNPMRSLPRLRNRALLRRLPLVWGIAAAVAVVGAAAGYAGWPAAWNADFAEMLRRDEMRPRRFIAVYGAHLGAYAGGVVGTVAGVVSVQRGRRRLIRTAGGDPTPESV